MSQSFLKPARYLIAGLAYLLAQNAYAVTVNFIVTGDVDDALGTSSPNDFNLILGDTISATGSFDDSGLTGSGAESVALTSITLTVGSFTFDETDDIQGSGFPTIDFNNGAFVGINFDAVVQTFGFFNSAGALGTFQGFDDNFGSIAGTWDVNSYVPVPAAVWLFGSGLIGLAGVARRKRNKV